jgi:hypothetical protein
VIAGTAKAFNLTPHYVLYEMSYANLLLYSASLPSIRNRRKGKGEAPEQDVIDAGDRRNRKRVSDFLNSYD